MFKALSREKEGGDEGPCLWSPVCVRSFDVRGTSKIDPIQSQPASWQSADPEFSQFSGSSVPGLWIRAVDRSRGLGPWIGAMDWGRGSEPWAGVGEQV